MSHSDDEVIVGIFSTSRSKIPGEKFKQKILHPVQSLYRLNFSKKNSYLHEITVGLACKTSKIVRVSEKLILP